MIVLPGERPMSPKSAGAAQHAVAAPVGSSEFVRFHQVAGGESHRSRQLRRPPWVSVHAYGPRLISPSGARMGAACVRPTDQSAHPGFGAPPPMPLNQISRCTWYSSPLVLAQNSGTLGISRVCGPGAGQILSRNGGLSSDARPVEAPYPKRPGAAPGLESFAGRCDRNALSQFRPANTRLQATWPSRSALRPSA